MRLLLDSTNSPGSEADASLPKYGGDVFGKGIDPQVPVDDGYQPGDNIRSSYGAVDPQDDEESYRSMNEGQKANPDYEGYESQNKENFSDPEFQASKKQREKLRLIDEAKKIMRRGADRVPGRIAARAGAPTDVVNALRNDTPEGRQAVKDFAQKKAREFAKDEIGKQIGNKALRTGFRKGMSKGAGKAIKDGGKQVAKSAGKALSKGVAKGAAQAGAKVGAKVGTAAAVEGGIAVAGAATGAATFGLGFVLSILLDIAISLGLNDAVDAAFELKEGNVKEATFLAIRAGTKVGIFLWFLIALIFTFSIAGIFISVPILIGLNIYMILGSIPAFKRVPQLQGMVGWEKAILLLIDLFAILILAAFIGGIVYFLCIKTGLSGGGLSGAAAGAAASIYDWWTGGSGATYARHVCQNISPTQ